MATAAGRSAAWLSRNVLGNDGGVIGGAVMLKVAPDLVDQLSLGRTITLVSGTNGKSTTTAMLTAALRTARACATNADGANTPQGIATALANSREAHVVLETDEAWLPWTIRETRPHSVCLLNLSRDQLHRNPETHSIARAWREAVTGVPIVVANADDPAVVWAAQGARTQVWVAAGQDWRQDSVTCPSCGSLLDRRTPDWSCSCGLRRPQAEWTVTDGRVRHHGAEVAAHLTLPGAVNLGNAAVALATAWAEGAPSSDAAAAVSALHAVAGRYAHLQHDNHDVRLILAKNPAGWQTALQLLDEHHAPVVLAFNCEGVDGRDPSWLYDVDFTSLRDRPVSVSGGRGTDMSVRLRMDRVEPVGQYDELAAAVRVLPPGPVDLVANYSAFQRARKELGHAC